MAPRRPQYGGGQHPAAGGGGGGGPHRTQQQPRHGAGGGGGNQQLVKALLGTQWVAEVADKDDPSAVRDVNLEEVLDVSKLLNNEMMPLLKYVVDRGDMERFAANKMSPAEQRDFVVKLQSVFLRTENETAQAKAADARVESDPNYALEQALGCTPLPAMTPRRATPAEVLDRWRAELMAAHNMTAEEFELHKQATIADYNESLPSLDAPTTEAQQAQLEALLTDSVPRDHPHYPAIKAKLQVLQGNPGWPHERKLVFARRLIKQLA